MYTSPERLQKLPEIPKDNIIDILLRLPVKSLLRFKLVSKTWYNVIKSPSFISMHHNFGTESQLLICPNNYNYKGNYDHVFSLRSIDKHARRVLSPDLEIPATRDHRVFVAGSCNGIVCYFDYLTQIFLCNPATREFKKLPPTSINSDLELLLCGVCFGSDSSNINDFKVLRVFSVARPMIGYLNLKTSRAEMFTLSSNTWRHIEWGLDTDLRFLEHRGLFWANSFHFLAELSTSSSYELTIVCLDFHTQKVTKLMDFPLKADHLGHLEIRNSISLMVVKEFLSVVFTGRGERGDYSSVEIWIMKLYRFRTPLRIDRALCFVWMDEQALLLVQNTSDKLLTCDLDALHFVGIQIDGYKWHAEIVVHKESLVSIMRERLQCQENLL